jgi:hypothetical protein
VSESSSRNESSPHRASRQTYGLEAALQDPAREFSCPADVAARRDWTIEERYAVLSQWKYDIGQVDLATEENMPPSDEHMRFSDSQDQVTIADIHKAIESLGMPTDTISGPTKGA